MIRLFAAVAVPEDIGADLLRRQQGVPGARWRSLEQLHVTLRFFGEIDEAAASDLDGELARIDAAPFELELDGVGTFGEGREVHALWAGVRSSEPLERLHRKCESAARRAGLKPDARAYRPHVTLAYLRRAEGARVGAWVQDNALLRSPPFTVDRFGLYSSELGAGGSSYVLEREYRLS